jgi:hypothetical protein
VSEGGAVYPPDNRDRHFLELFQRICNNSVACFQFVSLCRAHYRSHAGIRRRRVLKSLLMDLVRDVRGIFRPPPPPVDHLVIANIRSTAPVLGELGGRLVAAERAVVWNGPADFRPAGAWDGDTLRLTHARRLSELLGLWHCYPRLAGEAWSVLHHVKRQHLQVTGQKTEIPWLHAFSSRVSLERARMAVRRQRPRSMIMGFDLAEHVAELAVACLEQGCQVVCLQHGGPGHHFYYLSLATQFGCWSAPIADFFNSFEARSGVRRVPPCQFASVGRTAALEDRELPPSGDAATVLYLAQDAPYVRGLMGDRTFHAVYAWLEQLAAALPETRFVQREHPSQNGRPHLAPGFVPCKPGNPLMQDFQDAAIVLTMLSTAGIEAAVVGRPVVFMTGRDLIWLPSHAFLRALFVTSAEELTQRVLRLCREPGYRQRYQRLCTRLCRQFFGEQGCAAQRLFEWVQAGRPAAHP